MNSGRGYAISMVWGTLSGFARLLGDLRLRPRFRLDAERIISVGNLQAGGAGKTPIVAQIAREALARGKTVCILSRGYRGKLENGGGLIAPTQAVVSAIEVGDEPALLHQKIPDAWIGVGRDRKRSYQRACEGLGKTFDLVILDDGFQSHTLERDLDVLALTSQRWGEAPFRDFSSAAARAQLLVWTKGEQKPALGSKLQENLISARFRLRSGSGKIFLVCGVGMPERVVAGAREAGWNVVRSIEREDHSYYDRAEIDHWLQEAQTLGAKLATTGKDWVKWKELGVSAEAIEVLEPEFELPDHADSETWRRILWGS